MKRFSWGAKDFDSFSLIHTECNPRIISLRVHVDVIRILKFKSHFPITYFTEFIYVNIRCVELDAILNYEEIFLGSK